MLDMTVHEFAWVDPKRWSEVSLSCIILWLLCRGNYCLSVSNLQDFTSSEAYLLHGRWLVIRNKGTHSKKMWSHDCIVWNGLTPCWPLSWTTYTWGHCWVKLMTFFMMTEWQWCSHKLVINYLHVIWFSAACLQAISKHCPELVT